jgi:hypothetical protein
MAVVAHREIQGPEGEFDAIAGRSYTRVLHVDVSDPLADGPAVVWKYLRELPSERDRFYFGKLYEFGQDGTNEIDVAFLRRASIRRLSDGDDFYTYVVTLEYGPPVGEDPLAISAPGGGFDPIEVDIDYAQFEEIAEQDIGGRTILNSARDPYNPGVTKDDSRYVVTITRNESAVDFDVFNQIKDTVNKQPFLGRKKRCVKAKPPKARRAWNPDTGYYWVVTYQFEIKDKEYRLPPTDVPSNSFWDPTPPDGPPSSTLGELIGQGWDKVILDAGFRYISGTSPSTTRKQILVDGVPVQDPIPLDGAGAVLDPDLQPKYRVYRVYPEYDYNTLGFGL